MSKATSWAIRLVPASIFVIAMCVAFMVAMVLVWSRDNEPPFLLHRYTVTPAYPGGTMLVVADVERNLSRQCEALYSRRFVDSSGAMHAIEPDTSMGVNSIKSMDRRSPGKLIFTVPISKDTPPGKGLIVTPLQYTCNPWHYRYPITMSLEMEAQVLAPSVPVLTP